MVGVGISTYMYHYISNSIVKLDFGRTQVWFYNARALQMMIHTQTIIRQSWRLFCLLYFHTGMSLFTDIQTRQQRSKFELHQWPLPHRRPWVLALWRRPSYPGKCPFILGLYEPHSLINLRCDVIRRLNFLSKCLATN